MASPPTPAPTMTAVGLEPAPPPPVAGAVGAVAVARVSGDSAPPLRARRGRGVHSAARRGATSGCARGGAHGDAAAAAALARRAAPLPPHRAARGAQLIRAAILPSTPRNPEAAGRALCRRLALLIIQTSPARL
jgi:hypothetical protein